MIWFMWSSIETLIEEEDVYAVMIGGDKLAAMYVSKGRLLLLESGWWNENCHQAS